MTDKPLRRRRWLKKILRVCVAIYLGLGIVMYFLQDWMIFPGAATQGQPQAMVRPVADQQLLTLSTAGGEKIALLFGAALLPDGSPHLDAAHRPTILYFYGNAMSLSGCFEEFSQFRRMGANVAIAEFVGYGLSTGKPSEAGVYATADTAYEYLAHRPDIDPKKIVPVGWSLGAAAAIHLASTKPVAALATFSAFTSMTDMGRQILPWLPTSLLLHHRFENERKMASVTCPIFMAHGTVDSLVPFKMNARLVAAAKGPVTVVPVTGGDHNDIFQIGGASLLRQFSEFINRGATP